MRSNDLDRSLPSLFSELVYGAPETGAFVLNRGDVGLLKSLDRLSAAEASSSRDGVLGSIVHLAYHLGAIRQIGPAVRGPKESE